ncbi:hypothetical protein CBFG_04170 [Clostridiales bacterium 1_7_47FAA]|nr:hypothetical protein CBFG_04170 [Clostridiales bacterium 1_7_47FAA]
MGTKVAESEVHPSVSGMGMGDSDTALGLAALSLRQPALDKRLAAKTRAQSLPTVLRLGSDNGASLLAPLPAG